mmetsp:Transcript_6106/g.13268  ORF Transcript_6106/g.13268 Transcript_6106/m.13268 type:complete len:385 (+) Transcript_6106:260-1414(+)
MGSSSFKFVNSIEEDHKRPVFCITFNFIDPKHKDVFASVGSNRATVYQCKPNGVFDTLQVYVDEDKDEFYVCKWTRHEETGAPLLLLAGHSGVIRVLDVSREVLLHSFSGHGNSINDIAVLPQRPSLFLTASKDESIRLWNVRSKSCVLVIYGEGGHRNEVLSLDFHPWDGHRFLSCGMDNMVKIWSLKEHTPLLDQSCAWANTRVSFPTKNLQHPVFSSKQIHGNYVDCVRWLGDLCLSKSVTGKILLWRAEEISEPGVVTATKFTVLQEYPLPDSHIWFVRFSLDPTLSLLACGNRQGKVFVWNPNQVPAELKQKLGAKKCTTVVRQTAVSWDGCTVLASCEDGTIWRWDKVAGEGVEGVVEGETEDPDTEVVPVADDEMRT